MTYKEEQEALNELVASGEIVTSRDLNGEIRYWHSDNAKEAEEADNLFEKIMLPKASNSNSTGGL